MREIFVENNVNMSWDYRQEQFSSSQCSQSQHFMQDSPQQVSSVEQVIVNLSKILGDSISDQKNINTHIIQRMDYIETSLNQKFDSMQADVNKKFDNI